MILQFSGGLYVPYEPPKEKTQAELMAEYRKQHCCCPACGESDYSQTCIGRIITPPWQEYVDPNDATCMRCGWHGKVHDLTPERNLSEPNND